MKRLLLVVGLAAMMMFVSAPGAQAVLYDITSDHVTGGAGDPPFGTVSLVQDGTSVDFTVTLFDGSLFVRTGAGADMNFLFNGTGVVVGDISGTGITAYSELPDLLHADGTGDWMFGVYFTGQDIGGGDGIAGPLVFSVADATIADLIGGNGTGNIFAIDILSGQTGFTGMVDVSTPPHEVPEPSALLFLGSGLVGLALYGRKAFKR